MPVRTLLIEFWTLLVATLNRPFQLRKLLPARRSISSPTSLNGAFVRGSAAQSAGDAGWRMHLSPPAYVGNSGWRQQQQLL
mmetsp:Transcript_78033/g.171075  ORF Transcript_78033/g.171075 Transcript_78033/m.171075 type:complete len:81 (+) Transcript_78033:4541-4783(+)